MRPTRRAPIFGMALVFNPLPRRPLCDTIPEKASAHYSSRQQAPDFQRAAPRSAFTTGASSCHRVRTNPSRGARRHHRCRHCCVASITARRSRRGLGLARGGAGRLPFRTAGAAPSAVRRGGWASFLQTIIEVRSSIEWSAIVEETGGNYPATIRQMPSNHQRLSTI